MENNDTPYKCIYGAGKLGRCLFFFLKEIGYGINSFVQTDINEEIQIDGIPVISFETLSNVQGRKIVFIAIQNEKTVKQITNNLKEYFEDVYILNCKNFINDYLFLMPYKAIMKKKKCVICGKYVDKFIPNGINEDIFKKHHIIGGGLRQNVVCPSCGAGDRERWLYYVLKNNTDIFTMKGRVLHFAPERGVSRYIKENEQIDYYTGDIVPGRAMHITDITDLQYKDGIFDYVISNHVLEHISDEFKAVSEVMRVLKDDGKWILSFPICTDMETQEDKTITSSKQRLALYGQEDHVRLYGTDFIKRFEQYGLSIQVFSPQDTLDEEEIQMYGVIKDDILMIATKKIND